MQYRLLLVLALVVLAVASPVFADTRIVVRPFTGPNAVGVRRAVVKDLARTKLVIVENASAEVAAKRRKLSLGTAAGRKAVARDLQLVAWVDGAVVRRGGRVLVKISVKEARGNTPVGDWSVGRKLPRQLELAVKGIGPRIAVWVEDVSPPVRENSPQAQRPAASVARTSEGPTAARPGSAVAAQPEPRSSAQAAAPAATPAPPTPSVWTAPAAPSAEDQANGQTAESARPASPSGMPSFDLIPLPKPKVDGAQPSPRDVPARKFSTVELAAGVGLLNRRLSFRQPSSQLRQISGYTVPAAPVADVALRLFPAAFATQRWPAHIGIDVRTQVAFAVDSKSGDGIRYDTSYRALSGNLVGRYPIRRHELHLAVGFGQQRFVLTNEQGKDAPAPDVDYRAMRAGGGARVVVADWAALGFGATYLQTRAVGELADADWFPRLASAGVEGQLFADGHIGGLLHLRLFATYHHQFFLPRSKSTDQRVARSAADTFLTAGLALGLRY